MERDANWRSRVRGGYDLDGEPLPDRRRWMARRRLRALLYPTGGTTWPSVRAGDLVVHQFNALARVHKHTFHQANTAGKPERLIVINLWLWDSERFAAVCRLIFSVSKTPAGVVTRSVPMTSKAR